jgi:hypothetical protein
LRATYLGVSLPGSKQREDLTIATGPGKQFIEVRIADQDVFLDAPVARMLAEGLRLAADEAEGPARGV